jgi:hypothetical protein
MNARSTRRSAYLTIVPSPPAHIPAPPTTTRAPFHAFLPLLQAYESLRRWGVRYVLGEWLPIKFRPSEAAHAEAVLEREAAAATPEERARLPRVPPFDPDLFLDGQLKRVFRAGR